MGIVGEEIEARGNLDKGTEDEININIGPSMSLALEENSVEDNYGAIR